jgi:hypothetical protein
VENKNGKREDGGGIEWGEVKINRIGKSNGSRGKNWDKREETERQ